MCDRGYICNPSKCECECDRVCDVGEYLDYENCKCISCTINWGMYWNCWRSEVR